MTSQSYTKAPHPTANLVNTLVCDRYLLVETLGSGAFATVYRGVDTHCKQRTQYAIKCMIQGARGSSRQRRQVREVSAHRKVSSHPNVATIHNAILQEVDGAEGLIFIVLELCEKGDLCDAIVKRGIFWRNDALVKNVFLQIIDALMKCHSKGVYHMDLKPENILISSEDSESCQIRLGDFGLATTHKISKKNFVGSPSYMSPECIGKDTLDDPYASAPSDIWSLGIILINMCSAHFPWAHAIRSDPSFASYLNVRGFLRRTTPISHECQTLLRQILHPDPEQRITLKRLREKIISIETFFMSEEDIAGATDHVREVVADIQRLRDPAPSSSQATSSKAPSVEEELQSEYSVCDCPSAPFPSVDGSESESLPASDSDESMSSSSSSASIQEAVTPIMNATEPELEVVEMMAGMELGEPVVFDMATPKQAEFGGWGKQPTQWESFVNENSEIFRLIR